MLHHRISSWNFRALASGDRMRDRGIALDPYLDHGVLLRVSQEVGISLEELGSHDSGARQVKTYAFLELGRSSPRTIVHVRTHALGLVMGALGGAF